MSVASEVKREILSIREGEPFTTGRFLKLGSRSAIDKALSRFVYCVYGLFQLSLLQEVVF